MLEVFSGCGRLSQAFADLAFGVATPLEAYPAKGVYVSSHDLLHDKTFPRLLQEITSGTYF